MIHLFHKNKFGRNISTTEEEKVVWRSHFKESEDSLSASVFGLIVYLPVAIIWELFKRSLCNFSVTTAPTKLLSFEFWPHWDTTDTTNTNFVEPDIYLEFDNCDIIIEAKRKDYVEQQDKNQWRNELIGYLNEYGHRGKPVCFVAISGLADVKLKQDPLLIREGFYHVRTTSWKRLLNAVQHQHHKQQINSQENWLVDNNTDRILKDLIISFSIHGFYVGTTLNSMPLQYGIQSTSLSTKRLSKFCFTRSIPNKFLNLDLNYKTFQKWKL